MYQVTHDGKTFDVATQQQMLDLMAVLSQELHPAGTRARINELEEENAGHDVGNGVLLDKIEELEAELDELRDELDKRVIVIKELFAERDDAREELRMIKISIASATEAYKALGGDELSENSLREADVQIECMGCHKLFGIGLTSDVPSICPDCIDSPQAKAWRAGPMGMGDVQADIDMLAADGGHDDHN